MEIRITGVLPPSPAVIPGDDLVMAHLAMESFTWLNPATQRIGSASRETMYDWIVDKQGKAYVVKQDGQFVYIFGAIFNGKKYIRTAENRTWTNALLDLQRSANKPPDAS